YRGALDRGGGRDGVRPDRDAERRSRVPIDARRRDRRPPRARRSGMTRVVVIGAGVTGLAAAHRLRIHHRADVTVLEGADRIGGAVGSVTVGDLRVEAGPDSFLARKPWALELCRDLGLADDLVPAAAAATQRWTERGLVPFPPGPFGIPTSLGELWGAR